MSSVTDESLERFLQRQESAPPPLLALGRRVGNWTIAAFIGRGGTSEVYRAVPVDGGPDAAVKVLVGEDERQRMRFARERDFLLAHSGGAFPRIHATGEIDAHPYLVMECLDDRPLPTKETAIVRYLLRVCKGLRQLHASGFVHRDLKPGNILWRGGTEPVIIDLGLMHRIDGVSDQASPVTESLSMVDGRPVGVGTPRYAAPEQFTGGAVAPAMDIHALGMIVHECFGGRLPSRWVAVVRRATSSIPEHRYSNVSAFVRAVYWSQWLRVWCWVKRASLAVFILLASLFAIGAYLRSRERAAASQSAMVVHVNAGADGVRSDGSARHPYRRIQAAIDAAASGAEIRVAAGRYDECLSVTGKCVRVTAPAGPGATVIWCPEKGRSTVRFGFGADGSSIRGFKITGGTGDLRSGTKDYYGGGVYADCPVTVEECWVVGNGVGSSRNDSAAFGGGLWSEHGQMTIRKCIVHRNFAWACGGGIGTGGTSDGALKIVDSYVVRNASPEKGAFGAGYVPPGGIGLAQNGRVEIANSVLAANGPCQLGAFFGIYSQGTFARLENCRIQGGVSRNGIETFRAADDTQPLDDESAGKLVQTLEDWMGREAGPEDRGGALPPMDR